MLIVTFIFKRLLENHVERTFSWLVNYRRHTKDYEVHTETVRP